MPAGYSGTPLAKKLGVREGQRTWRIDMPSSVAEEIASSGVTPILLKAPIIGLEMAHMFVVRRDELSLHLVRLRALLEPGGII